MVNITPGRHRDGLGLELTDWLRATPAWTPPGIESKGTDGSGGDCRDDLPLACEAECLVGGQASRVHGLQYRHFEIGVVIDTHARLSVVSAHEAARVLDEAALEGDREGEEEGVELRAVETLAEVLAGGDDDERLVSWRVLGLVEDRSPVRFASPPSSKSTGTSLLCSRSASAWQCCFHWLSRRQRLPSASAARTSSQTRTVRCWSSASRRRTSWIGCSAAPVAAVGGGGEAEEVAGGGVPNSSLEGEGG